MTPIIFWLLIALVLSFYIHVDNKRKKLKEQAQQASDNAKALLERDSYEVFKQ